MDNQKIGNLILELRKSKNLTQRGLADILNVTDKAVSKWGRGIGYPEITLLPNLAEALGISVGELLSGNPIANEESEISMEVIPKADGLVSDVTEYSEEYRKQKTSRKNFIYLLIVTSTFLLAIFVCLLCNFAINRKIDWSLYVLGSEVTAWLVIAPFFIFKKYHIIAAMAGLSISILPLLILIEYLCPVKNWVFPFALPIVGMSLLSMWVSVILFVFTKLNRAYLTCFMFILFGIILNLSISSFVSTYLKLSNDNFSNQIIAIACGFIAIILFGVEFYKSKIKD